MTKVLATGRLAADVSDHLQKANANLDLRICDHPTDADLAWADCLTGFGWPSAATQPVRWIHAMGLGIDGFAQAPRSEVLTRTIGSLPQQMGRYVQAALLSHLQRHEEYAAAQHARTWAPQEPHPLPAEALVLGTGVAASGVAQALQALGIVVTGVNRSGALAAGFSTVITWGELMSGAGPLPDVLINVLPLTAATTGSVDEKLFDRCNGSLFINVGRGASVDESALQRALRDGHVDAAWLDVHSTEPLDARHWAWRHPRVRVTPHVAALTTPAEAAEALLDALGSFEAGILPANAVNLSHYDERTDER